MTIFHRDHTFSSSSFSKSLSKSFGMLSLLLGVSSMAHIDAAHASSAPITPPTTASADNIVTHTNLPMNGSLTDPSKTDPNVPPENAMKGAEKPLSPDDVSMLPGTKKAKPLNASGTNQPFDSIPMNGTSPTSFDNKNAAPYGMDFAKTESTTPPPVAPCCAKEKEAEVAASATAGQPAQGDASKMTDTAPGVVATPVATPVVATEKVEDAKTKVESPASEKSDLKKADAAPINPLQDTHRAETYFTDELNFTTNIHGLKDAVEAEKTNIMIIDLRDEDAFKKGHVPGAINMPWKKYGSFDGAQTEFTELSKDKIAYVYCYELLCNLGAKAARKFASLGYPVKEVRGGFDMWEKGGNKIEISK